MGLRRLSDDFPTLVVYTESRQLTDVRASVSDEPQDYVAYLVRLWKVGNGDETTWRVSVENPHTGERHGLASLEALFDFLREKVKDRSAEDSSPRVV